VERTGHSFASSSERSAAESSPCVSSRRSLAGHVSEVSEFSSEISEIASEISEGFGARMTASLDTSLLEARDLIEDIAGQMAPGSKIKGMLVKVAREAKLDYGRVKRLWYREARQIRAFEMDLLRGAAQRRREARLRREFQRVEARIETFGTLEKQDVQVAPDEAGLAESPEGGSRDGPGGASGALAGAPPFSGQARDGA
jgi:hypothetical protein